MSDAASMFETPVFLDLGFRKPLRAVRGPVDALGVLMSREWPSRAGVAYENAISMCLRAIGGTVQPCDASKAFEGAARAAFILRDVSVEA